MRASFTVLLMVGARGNHRCIFEVVVQEPGLSCASSLVSAVSCACYFTFFFSELHNFIPHKFQVKWDMSQYCIFVIGFAVVKKVNN